MSSLETPALLPHMDEISILETPQLAVRRFQMQDDIYKTTVLQLASDCTEDDIDQQFLRISVELGINVPVNPQITLDLVARNVSALNLDSDSDNATPTSRFSQSLQSTSDSASEQRSPTNASTMLNGSVTSPPSSIASGSSRRSSYISLKSGFQKISALRRRRTLDAPLPVLILPTQTLKSARPPQEESIAEPCATTTARCTSPIGTDEVSPEEPPSPPLVGEPGECDFESRQRSLQDARLRLLRADQTEERDRFGRFEASQHRLMRFVQVKAKQGMTERYRDQQQSMESRHADALASLEHGHLSAEMDLHRTLKLERQGCETRLRHMQAYCDPSVTIEGMPARTVTKKDQRLMEQQRHVCNCLDNLHTSRINVLREKQAKQMERVSARQQAELERLSDDLRHEMEDLDGACEADVLQLGQDLSERKERLMARWAVAEAIERRKLENQTGETYAPLPLISWEERSRVEFEEGKESTKEEMERAESK